MKNDKFRVVLLVMATVLLLTTVSLYGFQVVSMKKVNLGSSIAFVVPLLVIVFMVFFITKRYRDINQSMPFEDERSKKVMTHAAAKAFYISLYWLFCISFFESFFANMFGVEHLDAGRTVGGGIAGMAIAWVACFLYYDKKGKLL